MRLRVDTRGYFFTKHYLSVLYDSFCETKSIGELLQWAHENGIEKLKEAKGTVIDLEGDLVLIKVRLSESEVTSIKLTWAEYFN